MSIRIAVTILLLLPAVCFAADIESTFVSGGEYMSSPSECHDAFTSGTTADSAKNYGATTSRSTSTGTRFLVSWGRPRRTWWNSVDYCSCGINAAGGGFAATTVSGYEMLRPVYDLTGNNNGTNADSLENHHRAWKEMKTANDSVWRTNGMDGASDAGTWNRGTGTNGYDRKSTAMATITVPQSAAQGFFYSTCDTVWIRKVLLGTNDEMAMLFKFDAGGATVYSADTYSGDVYPYAPVIKFKLSYTATTPNYRVSSTALGIRGSQTGSSSRGKQ